MNEIFLIVLTVVLIVLPQIILKKLSQAFRLKLKFGTAIVFLIFIWIASKDLPIKVIISVLVATHLYREYIIFKNQKA